MTSSGAWCAAAPLWGTPHMQLELRRDQRLVQRQAAATATATAAAAATARHWDSGFAHMMALPGLYLVADLVRLMRALNTMQRTLDRSRMDTGARRVLLLAEHYGAGTTITIPARTQARHPMREVRPVKRQNPGKGTRTDRFLIFTSVLHPAKGTSPRYGWFVKQGRDTPRSTHTRAQV